MDLTSQSIGNNVRQTGVVSSFIAIGETITCFRRNVAAGLFQRAGVRMDENDSLRWAKELWDEGADLVKNAIDDAANRKEISKAELFRFDLVKKRFDRAMEGFSEIAPASVVIGWTVSMVDSEERYICNSWRLSYVCDSVKENNRRRSDRQSPDELEAREWFGIALSSLVPVSPVEPIHSVSSAKSESTEGVWRTAQPHIQAAHENNFELFPRGGIGNSELAEFAQQLWDLKQSGKLERGDKTRIAREICSSNEDDAQGLLSNLRAYQSRKQICKF